MARTTPKLPAPWTVAAKRAVYLAGTIALGAAAVLFVSLLAAGYGVTVTGKCALLTALGLGAAMGFAGLAFAVWAIVLSAPLWQPLLFEARHRRAK
jgi:hypothetical protein